MAAVAAHPRVELTPRLGRPKRPPPLGRLTAPERAELVQIERELDELGIDRQRPKTRGDCPPDNEPCAFISCRHHAAIEITSTGHVRLRFPHLEVWEIPETCTLRLADRAAKAAEASDGKRAAHHSGMPVEEIARVLNVTRSAVMQFEAGALRSFREGLKKLEAGETQQPITRTRSTS